MALDLRDFRTKLPLETLAVIKGYASAFGKDDAEIAREILNEWAKKICHAAKVTEAHLRVEGITGYGKE